MIDVITHTNANLNLQALDEMYRMRHRVFVDGMKWEDLRKPDGREIDQFDNEDAIYLLLKDEDRVLGGHRLLPTVKPHLFSELFNDMCDVKGVRTGARIYELNRTCVDKSVLAGDRERWGLRMIMAGLFEFCVRAGVEQLTLLTPLNTLYRCLLMGVEVKPLGTPRDIDGIPQAAVAFVTNQATLDNVRQAFGIKENIVHYVTADGETPLSEIVSGALKRQAA
jgi:acyl-homoserine lactone synthase